jgi:hypothetical protein
LPGDFLLRIRCLLLIALVAVPGYAQLRAVRGVPAVGAPTLSGYIIQGKPCIPMKRFGIDSGYLINVSPSGRIIAVVVNKKMSKLVDGNRALVGNQHLPLSIQPVARNNDFYLPLEFFEKAYIVRFTWDKKAGTLLAQLPHRTLKIPLAPLPESKQPSPQQ